MLIRMLSFVYLGYSIFRPLPNRSGTMPGAAMKKMKPAGVKSLPG